MTETTKRELSEDERLIHQAITILANQPSLWKDMLVDIEGRNGLERWSVRCTKQ